MRVRAEHWQVLLCFCEIHPELIRNKFNGLDGKAKAHIMWKTLANKLNALGYGEKSVEGWRKTLTDWKSKTKAKAAVKNKNMNKTGGGPPDVPPLTELEERLLSLMGKKAVVGDVEIHELGFGELPMAVKVPPEPTTEHIKLTEPATKECDFIDENFTCEPIKEHDYVVKRNVPGTQRKQTRRIAKRVNATSGELLQLSRKSVDLLETICANSESMANSLGIIANVMQSK